MAVPALGLLFIRPENSSPIAHVCLESSMHMSYPGHEQTVVLSHSCTNFKEIECAIELLHKELDDIKAEARGRFSDTK